MVTIFCCTRKANISLFEFYSIGSVFAPCQRRGN
jgi:hypothetical protein